MSAKISVKRLETFFNLREQSHERYSRRQEPVFAGDPVVEIKNGSFSWTDEKSSLHGINLTVSIPDALVLGLELTCIIRLARVNLLLLSVKSAAAKAPFFQPSRARLNASMVRP